MLIDLMSIVIDVIKDVTVAVATTYILSKLKRKKNHSSSQDGNGSSSNSSD